MNGKEKAVALVLGLFLLVGCGMADSITPESTGQTSVVLNQQTEKETWQPAGMMIPVSGQTVWSTQGDVAWGEGDELVDGGTLLCAVDLQTGKRKVFCAENSCPHTDRSCGGWLAMGDSIHLCPLPDGTLALLYGPGLPEENEPLTLELRDKTGRVLRSAQVEPESLFGLVYSDGAALYLIRQEHQQSERGAITDVLVRISLEDDTFGEKQEITRWENEREHFLPGICTENGILAAKTAFEKSADGERMPMGGVLYELCWDGSRRTLARAQKGQAFWMSFSGQMAVFRYDYDTGALEQLDLETGVFRSFAQLRPGLSLIGGAVFTNGWLFCNVSDGAQNFTIAVQQDRQPQRSPLQAVHNGRQQTAMVQQALDGGKLLVEVGQIESPVQYLDDDGRLTEGVTTETLWGVFTPEQYLAGDANCVMVEPERGT